MDGYQARQDQIDPHDKAESYKIFESIAPRYDKINRYISMGMDQYWRRSIRKFLPDFRTMEVLDIATGTADVALTLAKDPRIKNVIGLDLSKRMLDLGWQKVVSKGHEDKISLQIGDAMNLAFPPASFHAVTIAFGIRNIHNVSTCLEQIRKVLKPGGRLIILESSIPNNRIMKIPHKFFVGYWLPLLGGFLSGNYRAYQYLHATIDSFPYGQEFVNHLCSAGFNNCNFKPLSFGAVNLYWGEKD